MHVGQACAVDVAEPLDGHHVQAGRDPAPVVVAPVPFQDVRSGGGADGAGCDFGFDTFAEITTAAAWEDWTLKVHNLTVVPVAPAAAR